ncbi:ATP-binding protein [Sphingomonas sp. Leaf25]|uniref:ATP-binding protein n=1 Tax=Sphingomonas sp. Leaf25 TaxID=1735692 RepID=UPI0006F862BA|nr:ATP-binding protein [Sphingomonas sp. Leaf25]KQM96472.1 ATPase [Sphingomonas sp. Leaf25]
MTDPLFRIAEALERLAPPPPAAADPLGHPAYGWDGQVLRATRGFRPVPLDRLVGIEVQKGALTANLDRLAAGAAAHDVLLWGARGTGKSALVKASVGQVQATGGALALVEAPATALDGLPRLFALLDGVARAFVVFVDDLGFDTPAEGRALRSLLEGGAEGRPGNVRLIVTANRRHLVPRDLKEQDSAINPRDTVDDALALADRFGLSLGFHVVDQDQYVAIVERYCAAYTLPFDAHDAIGWATKRGSRSGRVAWQYVTDLAGRHGKAV